MPVFLDSNIILYAVELHPESPDKTAIAKALLDRDDCALSVQVLQEFFVQATKAHRVTRLSLDQAQAAVERLKRYPVQEMTLSILDHAMAIHRRYKFSYWDCAIIAAARAQGCDTLYSEDMGHQQAVESVRIIDPFH